jgi:tyrosine decarboxylase/aspartate 1-decarboxylase
MQDNGIDKQKIFKILDKKLAKDYSYESGYILGSMCTEPLEIAKEVLLKYIEKNLGDPGLFLGTSALEEELTREIGGLFGDKNIIGTFTTGGSEANLIAMRIAKKLHPEISNPEFIVPVSAHISFDKAADLLDIKLKKAELDENFELDLEHFSSLINRNTCGAVGIAGTTSLGLVDPIKKMGDIIDDKNIFFHVDAAFGGFILPFLSLLNYQIPAWNFSVDAVDSITADPHKMGLGIIPSGGFFIRNAEVLQRTGFEIPYLAGGTFKHFHLIGTRPGAPIIAFWAILRKLGIKGFTEIVEKCMDNTHFLVKRINEINGVKVVANPVMNVVGITTENGESISTLDTALRERKWMLGKFKYFNLIRAVVMPHVKKTHLINFTNDLEVISKKLKLG